MSRRIVRRQLTQALTPDADEVLRLHRAVGNQAVQRMLQTKLSIGAPGDRYEQEADRVAEQVTRTSNPQPQKSCACGGQCPRCQMDRAGEQRTHTPAAPGRDSGGADTILPSIVGDVLRSPGRPLDPGTRAFMESRFGRDFSQVRVHTGAEAGIAAQAVEARAYTVGTDIVFAPGEYVPASPAGQRLLAHELAHVEQQSRGAGPSSVVQRQKASTPTRRGRILSVQEIGSDPAREKARKRTGQTAAKVCRSISAGAGKTNCPATLRPGLAVTIVADKAGGAWLQIQTPEQVPGFGPKEPLYVAAAFVEEIPAGKATAQPSPAAGRPIKDVLRLDQTVATKGLASAQSNYVDRAIERIESAPLGPDITLIPKGASGKGGISILKGDFHIDSDPLGAFHMGQNQVYVSREIAEAVVAELDTLTPGIPNYAYYLKDGIILPTILSDTTIPNLMPFVRLKREQDILALKANADLAEALLWWYVGARFPLKVRSGGSPGKEAVKKTVAGGSAGKAAFDAARIADELVASTKSLAHAGQKMLAAAKQLSAMAGLTAAQKVQVMLEFFKRIGFAISKAGVVDDGARFVMYSEDSRYAFAFVKDTGEILYAKFDMKSLQYVWQTVK